MKTNPSRVPRWDVFEITLNSTVLLANPFTDGVLAARFYSGGHTVEAAGFYDGGSTWKIRFMPERLGEYTFKTRSNIADLDGLCGRFTCTAPAPDNHGPVRVYKKYHFAAADGTPFFVHGTTAYAWTTSSPQVRAQTVESVARYNFNKLRMGFFPKHLAGHSLIDIAQEPPMLPYEGERGRMDFTRFNAAYFRQFEEDVRALLRRGIQADVILFHFYDFGLWGINPGLSPQEDLLYVRYIAARLSAYHNVWWCLANEYDLRLTPLSQTTHTVECRSDLKDWDAIGRALREADPYAHPRSIHNFTVGNVPDFEWMSHVALQNANTYAATLDLKRKYGKPVVVDEYGYEGNITGSVWGDRTPQEELARHVGAVMAGGYASHGESYIVDGNNRDIFWAYGGIMVGESAPRLRYFRSIMEQCPFTEMEPDTVIFNGGGGLCLREDTRTFLFFFQEPGRETGFSFLTTDMADSYDMTVYDLWNCTAKECGAVHGGRIDIALPPWALVKLTARATDK